MGNLWDALSRAYRMLGFETATAGDEVFRALVRIIVPACLNWIVSESSRKSGSTRRRMPPSNAGCRCSPRIPGDEDWPLHARHICG